MGKKTRPPQTLAKTPSEPDRDVTQWAKAILAAEGKRRTRSLLEGYRALSKNPKVTQFGRKQATERAKALSELL